MNDLPMVFVWIGILVVMGIIEAITFGLATIWFMAGALLAMICALLNFPVWLQITVFIVVSLVLLALTRPFAKRYLDSKKTTTNAESLIGHAAIVIEPVKAFSVGQVKVKGQVWTAVSENENEELSAGQEVIVTAIEGVKLLVKKA
jgi:membrane protein implicated in regulation of membrane protease activity